MIETQIEKLETELCEDCGCEMPKDSPDTCWACYVNAISEYNPQKGARIKAQLVADGFITSQT